MSTVLGTLAVQQFLSDYWQQQALFVSGALPAYTSPISAEELAGLAMEDEVESRIVRHNNDNWQVEPGPFARRTFLQTPDRDWSLLVQAVDLWVPEVAALREQFSFLPAWRFDDIMISYAAPGGGVGPHFDHYDVFLLQVEGERHWQIGNLCDQHSPLRDDTDLHILQDFDCQTEYTARPGDLLYLPPRLSHWGTASSASLTYSIGFRAPTLVEMLDDLIIELIAANNDSYYTDPPLSESMAATTIDPAFIHQAQSLLRQVIDDEDAMAQWFARYMTAPKYAELVHLTEERRVARLGEQTFVNGKPETF